MGMPVNKPPEKDPAFRSLVAHTCARAAQAGRHCGVLISSAWCDECAQDEDEDEETRTRTRTV